jgi:uroporphyrinogen-III synthase
MTSLPERVKEAVIVTRPAPGAADTAARLGALGFDPVMAPTVRIRSMQANLPAPEDVAGILVTSGQAIPAIPAGYRGAKLYAVGGATAARARRAGFADVTSADGNAAELAALVRATVAPGATLLLVTGRGLGHDLAASLRGAGFAVIRRCVYAPVPVRSLPVAALDAFRSGRVRAALFFSASSAINFSRMVERTALLDTIESTDAVAISPATAAALEQLPWRRILIATRPNQDAMLTLLQ